MHTHPASDAPRVTAAFVTLATGTHPSGKRESGVTLTRHEVRQLRQFAEDGHGLPAGALAMEAHLGYRFCNIPGTEPPEVLALYTEIRSHAGTVPFHEQQLKERCEGLIFEARRLTDDAGDLLDAIAAGPVSKADQLTFSRVLHGTQERAALQATKAGEAAKGLIVFAEVCTGSLGGRVNDKLDGLAGTPHDSDVFGQRAKLRRLNSAIEDTRRAYVRALGADEFNILGRRLDRTVYGQTAVEAQEAAEAVVYEYKKLVSQVAIPHRLLKSLGHRRAALSQAALTARAGAHGASHLASVWSTTSAALTEIVTSLDAAKTPADMQALAETLKPLVDAWTKVAALEEVNDDVFA